MVSKRTIFSVILIAVIAVPALSVLCIEEAEASSDYLEMDTGSLSLGSFDTRNAADIKITIKNYTLDEVSVKVWLTYQDNPDRILRQTTIEIPGEDEAVAVLNIKFEQQGSKNLRIWAGSEDAYFQDGQESVGYNFALSVSQSIWSNTITYVAIVAIVAIVGIAIFIKHRSAPKAEPGITFTELEEQRRSQRKGVEPAKSTRRSSRAPTAERRRYEGGGRRKR